jgi:hypothetical protein
MEEKIFREVNTMETELVNEKQSSIAIEKNSKGYNWAIKLYYDEEKTAHNEIISKLEMIDQDLKTKFGGD